MIFLIVFQAPDTASGTVPVRVGLFPNEPMSFTAKDGQARGIFPDIIRHIARKEGWPLEFVPDSWAGGLDRLSNGRIDLMISVVRSPEREARFDFTAVPVVTAWGQVYSGGSQNGIPNILDLAGKRVGVMDQDINAENFQALAREFRVACRYLTFPTYDDMCRALIADQVEAVVMSNVTGAHFQRKYGLRPTAILFSPVDACFAVKKGSHQWLITRIDQHLSEWKQNKDSVYYSILSRWYGDLPLRSRMPAKVIFSITGIVLGAGLVLLIWNRLLSLQIKRHTRELGIREEKYRTLSQKALVGIFQMDRQGRLIMANQRMARIFGHKTRKVFIKKTGNFQRILAAPDQFGGLIRDIDNSGVLEGKLTAFVSRDRHRIWGLLHIRKSDIDGKQPVYEGFLEDITRRHRHEQLLRSRLRLTRYAADHTTSQVLQRFLDEAESLTRSSIGFFYSASEDQTRGQIQVWSTNTARRLCSTTPDSCHHALDRAGVWADCARTMTPVIHNNYKTLPRRKGLPRGHIPILREMVVPVIRENRVTAILGVGNKPVDYHDADLEIVKELADTALEIILKKKTENQLRESEARYRRFVETSLEGIWAVDAGGRVTFANPTMARMLGCEAGDLIGRTTESFVFDEDVKDDEFRKALRQQGIHQQYEARFKKKNGEELWTIVSATPLTDEDGNVDGAFAMFTDITDRKSAEREIRDTQKRFLAILNGIESTIYVADVETHEILFMNDYMKRLFGEDLTGQPCWKALRHQDAPCPHCPSRFLADRNGADTGIHLREDQHPVTGRWNIYHDRAIHWVDGRMARLQITSDITQLKEMEKQQRDYEGKIRQAQKMEALGALASGIAHDFNNILFPILGYAELLADECPEERTLKKGLGEILTGARRARELVDQILTFSRQTEKREALLKPDLVIKEVIRLIRATLPATIRVDKYVAPDCKMIFGDPTQIHQVTMNLATNAFHAMEDTGGILRIRLENVPEEASLARPGPYVCLTVEDTGQGMDEQTREKIFDPYFTTKPKGKGTGLGLSVVQDIVLKYRGEIRLTSSPGRGSCFKVYFPALDKAREPRSAVVQPALPGGTEHILLVDDDTRVLELEREILVRLGYKVAMETSSRSALARVSEAPDRFDLVISDLTMPEMTGDRLTRQLAKAAPGLPVVICTGFSDRIGRRRAESLGVRQVLLKPVTKSDLAETVRAVLDKS